MRLRRCREPSPGFSEWSPISSILMSSAIDLHQVRDPRDHAANDVALVAFGRPPDLAKTERFEGGALLGIRAVGGLDLGDAEGRHHASVSGSAVGGLAVGPAAAMASSEALESEPLPTANCELPASSFGFGSSPRTSAMVRPRSSATSRGFLRLCSPTTVAFTRLIGFWLP